ncbi:hypothetical protein [Aliiglaciecola lipolytica]|uniref:Uncharacterized protein n=1 Tax=Aliiglaciecola lipolytica E3 TaxID=1127673 RepID=K6XX24_9ALTE|nr:hypothetical protein [Aliiglaciecola lipolytica]GAC16201.1 hypothetical protein GLIP_3590 [Aliiglaciecola lipolytica E3]
MSYKFKHYAQPVSSSLKSNYEAVFIEFAIGLICASFAYYTYDEALVLFLSTALIAGVCFLLTIHNFVLIVKQFKIDKKLKRLDEREKRESNFKGE